MTTKVLEDIYAEARVCSEQLRELGLTEWSEELDRALWGGSSGEILTLMAACITRTLRWPGRPPQPLRTRLKSLLARAVALLHEVGQGP